MPDNIEKCHVCGLREPRSKMIYVHVYTPDACKAWSEGWAHQTCHDEERERYLAARHATNLEIRNV